MNIKRFMNNLNTIAGIGRNDLGGIDRTAFSDYYYEALNMLKNYAQSKGFDTREDKMGNLFIEYNPSNKERYIMLGSHLDTVKNGGLYDGALGVFSALELLETFKEEEVSLNYGIIVAVFNAEEGSELGGTFGSRTICDRNDLNDKKLKDNLAKYNLTIEDLKSCKVDFKKIVLFMEIHIEQGAFLYNEGIDIGLVNGIVGITRYNIVVKGESNHAGTTPMQYRNDPIKKLPNIINKLYEFAEDYDNPFVFTIGDILVKPGMYNVIPRSAEIFTEVRDMEQKNIDEFFEKIKKYIREENVDCEITKIIEKPSVRLDEKIVDEVRKSAEELGLSFKEMSSGAGHDAKEIAHLVPTGLIFIPSVYGVSHSPKEFTEEDSIEKGIKVLIKTIKNINEGDQF